MNLTYLLIVPCFGMNKTIFIADPHFGKASSFQYCGIPVPEENTLEDCERLTLLVQKTGAEKCHIPR